MAQVKVRKAKITELVQDDRNLNKGTARGKELIQKSIGQFGAVRGVAVDKDNRIIAGNKTVENAIEQGVEEIIIVETTGKELVVTKRVDTSLDTMKGREMALADNATVQVDLKWDTEELDSVAGDFGIDITDWGLDVGVAENEYVQKIESPVYRATEENAPRIEELSDTSKKDELTEKIIASELPDDVRDFLLLAAMRHVVFHYDRIAEFYCHASKDVQQLMEDSALVIIDFEDAIRGGFVRSRMEMDEEFTREYGNEE